MKLQTNQPVQDRYAAKDYFTYGIRLQTLNAGGQQPGQFTVDAGWDFLWSKATMFAVDDGDAAADGGNNTPAPDLTIIITDTGSGRNLSNIPIPVTSIFGTGQLPFILPTQKLFQARATVAVTVINNGVINYDDVYLNFIGTQLFLRN